VTPEQEALVEALKSAAPDDQYNAPPLSLMRHMPTVRNLVLALAAQRDELKTALDLERMKSAETLKWALILADETMDRSALSDAESEAIEWVYAARDKAKEQGR